MAVDTVRLRSPYITEEVAQAIEAECTKRLGLDMKTGNILYEITTGDLMGTYDSRISVQVKRKEWIAESRKGLNSITRKGTGKVITKLEDCRPYLEIEASVHKLFLGHNVYGGTEDFIKACEYLVMFVEQALGIDLPRDRQKNTIARAWTVKRIDFAYIFNLGSMEAVEHFFYLMRNAYYGRRNAETYGLNGLRFNASTTALKFYHKGPEFRKHDQARLIRAGVMDIGQASEMLILATELLRVEVEIKSKKLKYDFQKTRYGSEPFVADITEEYLWTTYENEVSRVMKEGKKASTIVRDSLDVEEVLYAYYGKAKANALFGAFLKMTNFGVKKYKDSVPKATYYRHMKELREAGISVNLNNEINLEDINRVKESLVPLDFQPLRDDPRRMCGEDGQIDRLIEEMNSRQKKDIRMATDAQRESAIS